MIVFPNCKINLGLNITRKREDGYHDLETCFYPIPFRDVLEILPSTDTNSSIRQTGIKIETTPQNNLCIKAFALLLKDFPQLPALQFHLHKNIPAGAGLGGGSADASFTLKAINDRFKLNLNEPQLMDYALMLGSDCPFFISNKPSMAFGRGEQLTATPIDLSAYDLFLVCPPVHISTAEAFSKITPKIPAKAVATILKEPVQTWKEQLMNDFEEPVFSLKPELAAIKEALYTTGAIYASMSGSGSSLYGIYSKENNNRPSFADNYLIWNSIGKA